MHLIASHDGQYYYLVLCDSKGKIFVNDSRRPNCWIAVCGIHVSFCVNDPELFPPNALFEGHNVFEGDLFYPFFLEDMLFAYHVESDEWSKATTPFPMACKLPGRTGGPTVMKLQGSRILLSVAIFTETKERVGTSPPRIRRTLDGFVIWELQHTHQSYSWVELARTPLAFAQVHYDMFGGGMYAPKFVHSTALICMTNSSHSRHYCTVGRCMPPLVYDLSLGSWYFLPPYKDTEDLIILCSFQPAFPGLLP